MLKINLRIWILSLGIFEVRGVTAKIKRRFQTFRSTFFYKDPVYSQEKIEQCIFYVYMVLFLVHVPPGRVPFLVIDTWVFCRGVLGMTKHLVLDSDEEWPQIAFCKAGGCCSSSEAFRLSSLPRLRPFISAPGIACLTSCSYFFSFAGFGPSTRSFLRLVGLCWG